MCLKSFTNTVLWAIWQKNFFLPLPCCNHLLGRKGHFRQQLSAALEIIALLKSAVTAVHLIKKIRGENKKGEAYFGKNVEKIRNPQTPD